MMEAMHLRPSDQNEGSPGQGKPASSFTAGRAQGLLSEDCARQAYLLGLQFVIGLLREDHWTASDLQQRGPYLCLVSQDRTLLPDVPQCPFQAGELTQRRAVQEASPRRGVEFKCRSTRFHFVGYRLPYSLAPQQRPGAESQSSDAGAHPVVTSPDCQASCSRRADSGRGHGHCVTKFGTRSPIRRRHSFGGFLRIRTLVSGGAQTRSPGRRL